MREKYYWLFRPNLPDREPRLSLHGLGAGTFWLNSLWIGMNVQHWRGEKYKAAFTRFVTDRLRRSRANPRSRDRYG
jgi:hypothetical protein